MSIPQKANVEISNLAVHYWESSPFLSAKARLQLARCHQSQYDWLDTEFANLCGCQSWLASQKGLEETYLLLEYIRALAPYLQRRGLQAELVGWCEGGLHASKTVQQNPGWILLLCGKAQNALGRWDEATVSFQAAIEASEREDPPTHAQALLALGRLQFNQGAYGVAFETMNASERHLEQVADDEHLMTVRAEMAAYHLNRGDLDTALSLYLEIDRRRQYAGAPEPSDHTLLMLGVVYRKKKDYERAKAYLQRLLEGGEAQRSRSTTATAAHHLAWVYLSQGDLRRARSMCGRAIVLYEEIGDERGLSDAYEQLGCIVLTGGQGEEAISHLQRSLFMRRQLHNQQGEASSLRHLAIAYLTMGHLVTAFRHTRQSLLIYHRLGVLSRQRMLTMLRELLRWALGRRQWIK
jgi:tetratricopeptide (TPR) repeat protein